KAVEAARQVGEEAERGPVAPVQVVDGEQERRVGGQVRGQPVQAVQRGEASVAGRVVSRGRCEDPGGRDRRARGNTLTGPLVGKSRLVQLAHDPERKRLLELTPPRVQGGKSAVGRAPPPPRGEAGLPHPPPPPPNHPQPPAAPPDPPHRPPHRPHLPPPPP